MFVIQILQVAVKHIAKNKVGEWSSVSLIIMFCSNFLSGGIEGHKRLIVVSFLSSVAFPFPFTLLTAIHSF